MRLSIVFVLSAFLLGACSAGYNCKGMPEGVSCMSAREVYNATEYAEYLGTPAMSKDEEGKGEGKEDAGQKQQTAPVANPYATAVQGYQQDNPLPIRTPEQVMEIWVAPWEDNQGSLHMASTIYTEIEKRRWTVGESIINSDSRIQPLDVRARVQGRKSSSERNPYEPPDLSDVTLNHPLEGEKSENN
ncbi:MAG: type IV conjugative transfer system lipoprotein TraV [Desulfuromonas thiophila]|jgi:conjugal transfer pilus assembly protein TraV|nr:type IV conjugative transfer system lipoprotein TraV [Desulfuromonas thiophila]